MSEFEEWITTEMGAVLTGYTASYLRQLARRGLMEARKVSRDWLINRESLLDYKRRMDRLGPQKHNPWREDLDAQGRGRRDREGSSER